MVYNIDKLDKKAPMYCVRSKLFESKGENDVLFDYELKPKHYMLQLDTLVYLGNLQGLCGL